MAFVDVEIPEPEAGSFFKFIAIGDRFIGRYLGCAMGQAGEFEGRAIPAKMRYNFNTAEGPQSIDPHTHLAKGLEKAIADGLLKPGVKVLITYHADKDVGKQSPMKLYKLAIDSSPAPAGAAKPAAAAAAPTAAQKAAKLRAELAALEGPAPTGTDDDIPF